jgi:hypothetical protein
MKEAYDTVLRCKYSIIFWMKEALYYYSVQATRGGILSRQKKRKTSSNMKLQDGPPSWATLV